MEYDLFITHPRANAWTSCLARNLRLRGYRIFDDSELTADRFFFERRAEALEASGKAIIILPADDREREWAETAMDEMSIPFAILSAGQVAEINPPDGVRRFAVYDSTENTYRETLAQILLWLENQHSTQPEALTAYVEVPDVLSYSRLALPALLPSEQDFCHEIMRTVAGSTTSVVLLLAQAGREVFPVLDALALKARRAFHETNVLEIFPPYGGNLKKELYYRHISRQCPGPDQGTDFYYALAEKLNAKLRALSPGARLLFIVHGLEDGSRENVLRLALMINDLSRKHSNSLRTLVSGGQEILRLKMEAPEHSQFRGAEIRRFPELSTQDLLHWQRRNYPTLKFDASTADHLVRFCGGHSGLLRLCFEWWSINSDQKAADIEEKIRANPDIRQCIRQLFLPYSREHRRRNVCKWLNEEGFGSFDEWPPNEDLRDLYWNNLLVNRDGRFRWRCELLREGGKEVLRCGNP